MNSNTQKEKGFSVDPIYCNHTEKHVVSPKDEQLKAHGDCLSCGDGSECWLCVACYNTYCSRYVKGHFREHVEKSGHSIGLSLQDLSFWCYECDSYVKHPSLQTIYNKIHLLKFGVHPGQQATAEESAALREVLVSKKEEKSEEDSSDEVNFLLQVIKQQNEEEEEEEGSSDGEEVKVISGGNFFELFRKLPAKKPKREHTQQWFVEGLDEKILENKTIDRILGCIYGNALGDAYGLSTEFQYRPEINKIYGDKQIPFPLFERNFHNSRWEIGDWTDDTDQMILILETLLETQKADEKLFAKKLQYWVHNGFPDLGDYAGMGLGATVSQVVSHEKFIESPHTAAELVWIRLDRNAAPNGAIMRTSILGVWEFQDPKKVAENTINICKVTHFDSRCVASCVMATNIISKILSGASVSSAEEVKKVVESALSVALPLLDKQYEEEMLKHIVKDSSKESLRFLHLDESKAIGYTFKCLGSGIWGLYSDRNFKETMDLLAKEGGKISEIYGDINIEGDADTNGAVCGSLVGAKLGYSQLPKDWLVAMPNKDWYRIFLFFYLKGWIRKQFNF